MFTPNIEDLDATISYQTSDVISAMLTVPFIMIYCEMISTDI